LAATTLTATERYRLALLKYGDFLAASGEWCEAREQYEAAYNFGSDPSIEPTLTNASNECEDGRRQNDDDDDGGDQATEPPPTEGIPTTDTPATTEPPAEATPSPPPTEAYPAP
jgi:hypothetical protein